MARNQDINQLRNEWRREYIAAKQSMHITNHRLKSETRVSKRLELTKRKKYLDEYMVQLKLHKYMLF